jgi:hypothetical protein
MVKRTFSIDGRCAGSAAQHASSKEAMAGDTHVGTLGLNSLFTTRSVTWATICAGVDGSCADPVCAPVPPIQGRVIDPIVTCESDEVARDEKNDQS